MIMSVRTLPAAPASEAMVSVPARPGVFPLDGNAPQFGPMLDHEVFSSRGQTAANVPSQAQVAPSSSSAAVSAAPNPVRASSPLEVKGAAGSHRMSPRSDDQVCEAEATGPSDCEEKALPADADLQMAADSPATAADVGVIFLPMPPTAVLNVARTLFAKAPERGDDCEAIGAGDVCAAQHSAAVIAGRVSAGVAGAGTGDPVQDSSDAQPDSPFPRELSPLPGTGADIRVAANLGAIGGSQDGYGSQLRQAMHTASFVSSAIDLPGLLDMASGDAWVASVAADIASLQSPSDTLHFRLRPARLGTLDISVDVEDGRAQLLFKTETVAAQQMLIDSKRQLLDAAAGNGMMIDDLRIELATVAGSDAGPGRQHRHNDGRDRADVLMRRQDGSPDSDAPVGHSPNAEQARHFNYRFA